VLALCTRPLPAPPDGKCQRQLRKVPSTAVRILVPAAREHHLQQLLAPQGHVRLLCGAVGFRLRVGLLLLLKQ